MEAVDFVPTETGSVPECDTLTIPKSRFLPGDVVRMKFDKSLRAIIVVREFSPDDIVGGKWNYCIDLCPIGAQYQRVATVPEDNLLPLE